MLKITCESEYQFYLEKIGITESQLCEEQKQEMRRAFMAGFGQAIIFLINEAGSSSEKEMKEAILNLYQEIKEFWKKESLNH